MRDREIASATRLGDTRKDHEVREDEQAGAKRSDRSTFAGASMPHKWRTRVALHQPAGRSITDNVSSILEGPLPRALAVVACAALAAVALGLVEIALHGPGYQGGVEDIRHLVVCGLAVALLAARAWVVRVDRWVWRAFAAGMALNGVGDGLWVFGYGNAALSPADALYAASYVCIFIALGLYLRQRVGDSFATFWLDAAGIATYLMAIAGAVLLPPILAHGTGALSASLNVFYPCADAAIVSVVLAVGSMTGHRIRRQDGLLAAAFTLTLIADALYALSLAGVVPNLEGIFDLSWEFGFLLVGLAAWGTPTMPGSLRVGGWWEVFPTLSWLAAGGGVLVVAGFTDVHPVAIGFAALAIVAAALRTAMITRDVRQLVAFRQEALTDELTGLPNRRALFRELELLTHDGGRSAEHAGLLMLDINGFKDLNNALGHEAGDVLLRGLAHRLAPIVPGLLARHSGDGLAAVVYAPHDPHDVARAMLAALSEPVDVAGVAVALTAGIGIARFPADATTAGELARRAEVALEDAKRRGVGVGDYAPERDGHSRQRLALAADLRRALSESHDLWVAFQPQVAIASGAITGAEALIRWTHPSLGRIDPDVMLPVAEQTGLMPALTDWVLEQALTAAASWRRHGHPLAVSVNVSASTLVDALLPQRVDAALQRHGLEPETLVIEVTEQAVMTDAQRCGDVLAELRALGVEIAVDDFGTGNSSLTQLKQIPASELKVDKSFVMTMASDAMDREIVGAVVTMGRRLGHRVVAEGVETPAIWQALEALQCDVAQGFGVGRPMPAPEFARFLASPPDFLAVMTGRLRAA